MAPNANHTATDDFELLARAHKGDALAARLLVMRLSPPAHKLAWRMLGDAALAEDVVQEALEKLFRIRQYQGDARLSTYFHTMVSRMCLDRSRALDPVRFESELIDDSQLASDDPAPDQAMQQTQQSRQMQLAIAALPPRQRLAISLWAYQDSSVAEIAEVAQALETDAESIRRRLIELAEANPMLGHRGCRLGITYPEIYEMQAQAIFEGALAAAGVPPHPEIMIPLIGTRRELEITRAQVESVAAEVFAQAGRTIEYSVGTMIELPRAAITADKIAEQADFFSFGTNDLTQTVLGLSRDDAGKFLPAYVQQGILPKDPFVSIDVEGVGEMVRIATAKGRATKPGLKLGICGEHGGDPASIAFCAEVGLDYVSCSPYRVPVARLAAAQAALGAGGDRTA